MLRSILLTCLSSRDTGPEEESTNSIASPTVNSLTIKRVGLYDAKHERDSCGVGLVANVKGKKTHQMIVEAITLLTRLAHRSAYVEKDLGDGVGVQVALPDEFFQSVLKQEVRVTFRVDRILLGLGQHLYSTSKGQIWCRKRFFQSIEKCQRDEKIRGSSG